MKIVKTIILFAIGFLLIAVGHNFRHWIKEGFWPGLGGVLIGLGLLLLGTVITAQIARTPRRRRLAKAGGDKVATLLAAYPGPVTLKASRTGRVMLVVGVAACTLAGVSAFVALQAGHTAVGVDMTESAFEMSLLGLWASACSACAMLRGALRLDGNGFQATLFIRKQYLWIEARDFRISKYNGVQFDVVGPRLSFASSSKTLDDNYGLEADELADLMEA